MNYVDPSGHIPMALVSGVVGAVIGIIVDYAPVLLCNFIMHAGKLRNFVLRKKDLIYSAMSGMIDGLLVSSRLKRNAQMVAGAVKAGLITALKNRRKDITTLVTKVVKAAIWGGALAFLGGSGVGAKYWEKGLCRKGCYVYKGVSFCKYV